TVQGWARHVVWPGDEQRELALLQVQPCGRTVGEEFCDRTFKHPVRHLETQMPKRAGLLRLRFDFVDLLSRQAATAGHANAADAPALLERRARDAEVRAAKH